MLSLGVRDFALQHWILPFRSYINDMKQMQKYTIAAVAVRYKAICSIYPFLTHTKISLSRVEFIPEMDSLICLYTKVALTTGPSNFWIESKQPTIALLMDYCGKGAGGRWGPGGLSLEQFFRVTPSRTQENAIFERRIKDAIFKDFCVQRGN